MNTGAISAVNETDTNPSNNSDSVTINVPAVDVSITKSVDVPTANPGDTVTFTVTASNAGPDTATGVEVTDALPTGLTLVSVTPSSGSVVGSIWSIGSVVAGTNETLVVTATVDTGTAGSTITNIASVTGTNETDTTPGNNSESASVTIAAVDIALTKTIDNSAPNAGDTVTYTVTVTNNGPDAATGVSISEPLPGGVTLVSTATSQGSVSSSLWSVGTLNSGASATLTIVATVASGTGGTTVTNTVTVTSVAEEDTDLSNDSASASFTTQSADLDIDKVVDIANVAPGDTVTFTVTIANNGPDSATNIVVGDVLPAGLTAVSATASLGTWTAPQWTIPTLGTGTSATLVMVATVDAGLWNQTFVNTAAVTASDQEDPDPTNDSDNAIITTAPSADLAVAKSVDDTTPDAGDTVVFTITVTNIGPDDDPTVTVTDTLPGGLTFVSAAASTGSYDGLSGVWTVGTLPTGTTETLMISALVGASFGTTTITNLATVSGSLVDTEPANNQASADVIPTLVDVSIVKTSPGTATAGATISYSIIVSNSGPDTATGVSVIDILPSGVTYIGSAASLGTYNAASGVWTVGALNNAATATLTINVSVDSDTTGDVVNTATVSVTGPQDDTPANNTSVATTRVMVPPVANNDTVATPYETSVIIAVTANDTDADGTIDLTTVLVTTAPANGTVTVDPGTGDLTYVPNAGSSRADIFEYRVCDNDGLCDTASVFVTIDPQNDAPFPYVRDPDGDPQPVGVLSYTIEVGDTPDPLPLIDPNDDNIIVLEIIDGSLPLGLSINPDGTFSGAATTVGTYTVQVQICDDGTPQRCSLFSVIIHVGETLPFTGIEVLNFVRIGLLFVLGGATLLAFQWKREDEESRDNNAPTVS